jgi:endoglucanase Acf2
MVRTLVKQALMPLWLKSLGLVTLGLASGLALATTLGSGSFRDDIPNSVTPPSSIVSFDAAGLPSLTPAIPHTAPQFNQLPTVSKWWSHLLWHYWPINNQFNINLHSQVISPWPLQFLPRKEGAAIGVGKPVVNNNYQTNGSYPEYHFQYDQDFVIGIDGLQVNEAPRVLSYSDWAVTSIWNDGQRSQTMTSAQNSPYLYFTKTGGDVIVNFAVTPTLISNIGHVLAVTVHGNSYALFAPTGAIWSLNGTSARSSLNGKNYYSLAVLPNNLTATANDYAQYAFAFITDTRFTWSYNQATAKVTTQFSVTTTPKEGTTTTTLTALMRHQYISGATPNTSYRYASPRGQMQVFRGNSFSTTMAFNGILPSLPDKGDYDRVKLGAWIDEIYNDRNTAVPNKVWQEPLEGEQFDNYWMGCALGRLVNLTHIADQLGKTAQRDYFLDQIQQALQNWLSYSPGEADQYFAYSDTWKAIVPVLADVHLSSQMLNDHHFNYGYFIRAAAALVQYRPTWATSWGPMVEQLIKDASNWDRNDTRYPFMRHFSPMDGHTWATGPAFSTGQNEEAGSESVNFATGVILWGAATNNNTIRDMGIMHYANQVISLEQYWFDIDDLVFPATYTPNFSGMIWGDGASYSTWWTLNPREIHGMNLAPMQSGSVYLGRRPANIARVFETLNFYTPQYTGFIPPKDWRDFFWMYQAMADGNLASNQFDADSAFYNPAWYLTKAYTYHWVRNWKVLGQLDTSITANIPTYNVFNKAGIKSYVAYNPTAADLCVTFSDGRTMTVASKKMMTNGAACSTTRSPHKVVNLPGIIQAEDFDNGGQGTAYNDATTGNSGTVYRSENVDIQATTDAGGGYNVGWTTNGEWLEYSLANVASGTYNINLRVAAPAAGGSLQVLLAGQVLGTATVNATGGWQSWTTVTLNNVVVTAGTNKILRLNISGGNFNVNWVEFVAVPTSIKMEAEAGTIKGTASVYSDAAASGGQGMAYISTNGAGFTLNNVPASTSFELRYASTLSGNIAYYVNGVKGGNITFNSTGNWVTTYASVNVVKTIPAAAKVDIVFENGNSALNVDYITFKK